MVSIIIPNWNGVNVLRDCLRSLTNLKYIDYEIIVVDNGSTDNSVEMVKAEFPHVRLVVNSVNLGFPAACNIGIKNAMGEIIALLNNDVEVEASWLNSLVACIDENEIIAMVSGLIFYYQPTDFLWSAGARIDGITGMTYHVGRGARYPIKVTNDIDYLPGCAIVLRKKIFEKVGPFDEKYFLYCEEVDWTLRARRLGYTIKLEKNSVVWHKASITRRRNPAKGYYYFSRSLFRLYLIHFPLTNLLTSFLFQLLVFPVGELFLFKVSSLYLLCRIRAFLWNILNLKQTIVNRYNVRSSGQLKLKNRLGDLIAEIREHVSAKSYDF